VAWDDACVAELSRYDWPGNVRQLRRVVNRAMTFTESASPTLEDVQRALLDEDALRQVLAVQREERNVPAPHRDPAAIARAIAVEGTYERAARRLGISLRTLHRRVKAFGLRGSPRIA
jgi:transcriptional regulator of acetoin/glycerol metabolism